MSSCCGFRSGPDAPLRIQSVCALFTHTGYLTPRHDVKRQKSTLFYRKRLCVIYFGLMREAVCFTSGRQNDQLVQRISGFCLGVPSLCIPDTIDLSKALLWLRHLLESGRNLQTSISGTGDDGFFVSLRGVPVDKFSWFFAGNRVRLSLSRHRCAAAAHQIWAEHGTARGPYPTQVSTHDPFTI